MTHGEPVLRLSAWVEKIAHSCIPRTWVPIVKHLLFAASNSMSAYVQPPFCSNLPLSKMAAGSWFTITPMGYFGAFLLR